MSAVLQTNGLCIGYQKKNVQDIVASHIDICLEQGTMVALLGENGSGKSTLMRTLTGIQPKISGTLKIEGTDIERLDHSELSKKIAVVLTDALPPSDLSVWELVALGRQPYTNWIGKLAANDLDQIEKAMEATGIAHLSGRKHYELSSGQLQNVMIARALAQNTPLLVLDEPSNHLDFPRKVKLYQLLRNLAQQFGKCILFSTHELDIALQLSDSFLLLSKGKMVQGNREFLSENGHFATLFDSEQVRFDSESGRFYLKDTDRF